MKKKNRTGGVMFKGKTKKKENDVFVHPLHAKEIMKILLKHLDEKKVENANYKFDVLDACCNDGVLGVAISENLFESQTAYIDIKDKNIILKSDEDYFQKNILHYDEKKFDIIVCNPPWVPVTLPEKIYYHLLTLLKDDGILFYLINNTFCYQGWERAIKLKFQKFYFLPRFIFTWQGRSLLDCGIMVYHKNGKMPDKALNQNCFINLTGIKK